MATKQFTAPEVETALTVLADAIRPMSDNERNGFAEVLRCFGRDPDGVSFDALLAGLSFAQRPPAKIYQFSKRVSAK